MTRNKYAGICYHCSELVNKGEGHFEKIVGAYKAWRVIHSECVIKQRSEKNTEAERVRREGRE